MLRHLAVAPFVIAALVSGHALHAQSPAEITARVKTAVRSHPEPKATVIKTLAAGSHYYPELVSIKDGYIEVRDDGIQGFVALRDVSIRFAPIREAPAPVVRADTVTVYRLDTVTIQPKASTITIRPDVAIPDPAPPPGTQIIPKGPFTVILLTDIKYRIGHTNDTITVPAGFVTDFASIPRALWSVLSPVDDYKIPAVVHDYLYWFQPCSREQSDNLLLIAMQEEKVSLAARTAVYAGVRLGGQAAWEDDSKHRLLGEPRVVPPDLDHPDALDTWDSMRQRLMQNGLRGNPNALGPQHYCSYGDSQAVPQ